MTNFNRVKLVLLGCLAGMCAGEAANADIIPPKSYSVTPGGVNVADSSLVYSVTDLSIGSLTLERFYRSGGPAPLYKQPNNPPFGKNFSHNFDIYVSPNTVTGQGIVGRPIVHIGQSASGVYVHGNSSVLPNNDDARKGNLSWTGTQYEYMDSAGTIYTFSATVLVPGAAGGGGRAIERIDFPDGRRQTFSYNSSQYLKLVEDSAGYALVFDYNSNGDITSACAFNRAQNYVSATSTCSGAQLKTTYGYTNGGTGTLLASATDVLGRVTTYTNALSGMSCIKPPGYSVCTMSGGGGVQTLLDGGTWYAGANDPDANNPDGPYVGDCTNEGAVQDPNGVTISMTFTKTSPCSVTDANGNVTTFKFEGAHQFNDTGPVYTDGTFLREATYPEGNKYLAEYVGPFKSITKETMVPKPGSGLANLEKTYGYQSCTTLPGTYQNCAKPIWIKDPKGNQTDYTYASHGGLLSEMQPAPTAGAARPLKLTTYTQKFAYIKNSGGSLVQAATAIWMPSTETLCQTVGGGTTPTCDSTATQTVTTYEYGANGTANNLRVKGMTLASGVTTYRTCYGYDNQGNKIWETSPRAGLGSCP